MLYHVLDVLRLLNRPEVTEKDIRGLLDKGGVTLEFEKIRGEKGSTLFIRMIAEGKGDRTIGVVGRLGGVSARPELKGIVSDADGAIVALSIAAEIAEMYEHGDELPGKVIVTTHVTTHAPVKPYKPVPMMDSPVDMFTLLRREADPRMNAIISIDATKANYMVNHVGFAITPVVKEGWILRPTDELLGIYIRVAGTPPVIVPITMQDITPFTTDVYHINSIVQPWIYTKAPVLGVATTALMPVPGSGTGATNAYALDQASRFVMEVVKDYLAGRVELYYEEEFRKLVEKHGSLAEILSRGAPRLE